MRLHEEIRYDAAVEAVFAVLTDPAFLDARCAAAGALEHSREVRPSGAGTAVTVRRVLSTRGMPDFAARMLGATMTLTETTVWQAPDGRGERRGATTLRIEGAPVTLTGETVLRPEGGAGSVQVVSGDLVAKVPLFGGKVEQAAAPALRAGVLAEGALAARWLAERRS